MPRVENNRCYACGNLFCCSDCCAEHIKKKHPNRATECPLCRSERLIVKNFDNQQFLCHVVFHHLPLHCRMCGLEFKNCADLRSIASCNPLGCILPEKVRESLLSPELPETPSPVNKTPCGSSASTRTKEGEYNGNFGNFISPPELTRNTSTPMHVNLASLKSNFIFKTPRSPNLSLKTPKTSIPGSKKPGKDENANEKENDSPNRTDFKDPESVSCDESNYHSFSNSSRSIGPADRTPLRSILSNRSAMTSSDSSSYLARSNNAGRKMLDAMQELDENARIEDVIDYERGLTTSEESSLRNSDDTHHRDSIKRVRFSDQFQIKNEIETKDDPECTESEEFYEARQSISEMSMAVVEKLSVSSALINDENEKNIEKERGKEEEEDTRLRDGAFLESKQQNAASSSTTSSSSRVIMMVVVEKNGNLATTDLAPLIDSSLKKLVATSAETLSNSIEPAKRGNDDPRTGSAVLSVDSYMSVSTVECYKTPDSTINAAPKKTYGDNQSRNSCSSTGGIFAAMAHAMRAAFRNFSGASTSRNISREPIGQNENLALPSTIPESSSTSSTVLTNLASALVPRTAKRSRDSDDNLLLRSSDSPDPPNDVRSPMPKRPRGWYKIRAREPIARMRTNTVASPRGISSETQSFQQGSLSVGDTILTLPSRAHRSTQTD